jgi:peptidoglycan/LPS O-acetylase OafA/YrhL
MVKGNRIYQIDLLRFLAALSVVLYHYFFRGYAADSMTNLSFHNIGQIFKYGYLGVDLFFIISGFVISLSISHGSISKFAISRISRLYPIYWISVSMTFIITLMLGAPNFHNYFDQFLWNLTMFQNYMGVENIDGVYWSLFVEMKFYIFIIGTCLIVNKIKTIKLDYFIYIWLILTLLYIPLNRYSIIRTLNTYLIFSWSSYFIAGMVFYQIYKSKLSVRYVLLLSVSYIISLYHAVSKLPDMGMKYNTTFSPIIVVSVITLSYLLILLISLGKLNIINLSRFAKLGLLTYPLYLLHQNIGFIIFNNLEAYFNKYVIVLATTITIILLSYILATFYEPLISKSLKVRMDKFIKLASYKIKRSVIFSFNSTKS